MEKTHEIHPWQQQNAKEGEGNEAEKPNNKWQTIVSAINVEESPPDNKEENQNTNFAGCTDAPQSLHRRRSNSLMTETICAPPKKNNKDDSKSSVKLQAQWREHNITLARVRHIYPFADVNYQTW